LVYVGISASLILYIVIFVCSSYPVLGWSSVFWVPSCAVLLFHLLFLSVFILRWCVLFFLRTVVLVTVSLADVFRLSVGMASLLLLLFLLGVPNNNIVYSVYIVIHTGMNKFKFYFMAALVYIYTLSIFDSVLTYDCVNLASSSPRRQQTLAKTGELICQGNL
jgi:hypothetical protein